MKSFKKLHALIGLMAASLSCELCTQAAIVGQWDFEAGNLAPTIGSELIFYDDGLQPPLTYGTTTALGVSDIAGQAANVMRFPKFVNNYGSVYAYLGAAPNGGGFNVNNYTIIMDVLFPSSSSGKPRSLFYTDYWGGTPGGILINAANALTVGGGTAAGGSITPDVWHRIAVTVSTTNNITLFVDGVNVASQTTPGGLDGIFSIAGSINLFNDPNTNTEAGYVGSIQIQDDALPEGLIAALGTPTASGILTGPPPNPYTLSVAPTSDLRVPARSSVSPLPLLQIELIDGTATVDTGTVDLKLNGISVPPTIDRSAPNTTISYQVTNILASGSSNFVALTYQDSAANNLGAQYAFYVGQYVGLPSDAAQAPGSATTPGFIVRTVQASTTNDIANAKNLSRAIQQLNGTLLDLSGVLVPDLAIPGPNADGSYNENTINFHLDGTDYGVALGDAPFPGIPGSEGSGNMFASEVVTYLDLSAGVHQLGVSVSTARTDVNDDDGYAVYVGPDARNILSPVIATFNRGTVPSFATSFTTNRITVVAPVAGIYPFRLVYFQSGISQVGNDASFEFYSVDEATGDHILINDLLDARAIKAYRVSTAPTSNKPHIVQVSPAPGGSGVSPALPVEVLVFDDQTALEVASVRLYLNDQDVTGATTISKVGGKTTIFYQPNATRSNPTNDLRLVFSDNSLPTPISFTNDWSYTSAVAAGGLTKATGQWDFYNGDLSATIGLPLQYFTPDAANATSFGTCSSMGVPLINGEDTTIMHVPGDKGAGSRNLAYVMTHGISPNGGGTRVNQYTLIFDILLSTSGSGAGALLQVTDPDVNLTDGDLFWQGNNFGQGGGGYGGTGIWTPGSWHRVIAAYDEAATPPVVTKFVDGIKQDDWTANQGLDNNRRAMLPTALLFADGDQDERREFYVNSIQIREGKLSDAEMVALGGPNAAGIPVATPQTTAKGQWDFDYGDLRATVGKALQYFTPDASNATVFGTCSALGVPLIDGADELIMRVPGDKGAGSRNLAYIMDHGIKPNGGGSLVNQYTLIFDILLSTNGSGAGALLQVTDPDVNLTDGDLFWQGNNFGQGGNGYIGTGIWTPGSWHRVIAAYDEAAIPPVVTKFVDGIKQDDWTANQGLDNNRRAMLPTALLFADGDQDERREFYVNSIQIREGKLSDAEMVALGGISPGGIPVVVPILPVETAPSLSFGNNGDGTLTISWPLSVTGYELQSAASVNSGSVWSPEPGVVNNSVTVTIGPGAKFFRLQKQ